MKMNKIYKLIKLIVLVTAGVLILVFNKDIMGNNGAIINGVVGSVIAFYGLEGIILPLATKQTKREKIEIFGGVVNVLIAVTMIFLVEGNVDELRIVCVLWSVWSIIREGEEIFDKGFAGFKKHPVTSLINFAESIVVIVFSIELICAKDFEHLMHHAHVHVILLGIELIIEVLWVYLAEFESRLLRRIKRRRNKELQEENKEVKNT